MGLLYQPLCQPASPRHLLASVAPCTWPDRRQTTPPRVWPSTPTSSRWGQQRRQQHGSSSSSAALQMWQQRWIRNRGRRLWLLGEQRCPDQLTHRLCLLASTPDNNISNHCVLSIETCRNTQRNSLIYLRKFKNIGAGNFATIHLTPLARCPALSCTHVCVLCRNHAWTCGLGGVWHWQRQAARPEVAVKLHP